MQKKQAIQKPLILAVETSGRIGSVAIAFGQKLLDATTFSASVRHSAEIFPAVCDLLGRFNQKPHQIEHLYISVGPGSFTGLRIAVALAKTMHLANATKIVAVDTLDVIAANAYDLLYKKDSPIERIATILDAKRAKFFVAVYQRHFCKSTSTASDTEHVIKVPNKRTWKKVFGDSLMTAEQFLEEFAKKDQPLSLLGEGLVYHQQTFRADRISFLNEQYWYPRAENVHLLGWQKAQVGQFADPLSLTPAYLHRPLD